MPRISAGLLMFRRPQGQTQVLLVHPGGPIWAKRDQGVWTVPKGELDEGEDPLAAAVREFTEETGLPAPAAQDAAKLIPLGWIQQKGGKIVHAWAFEGDCDPDRVKSNTFDLQWPPGSGRWQTVPEIDRAEFFALDEARHKIKDRQVPFLDRLEAALKRR